MAFIELILPIEESDEIKEQVQIEIKYEGYIKKTYKEVEKLLYSNKKAQYNFNLSNISSVQYTPNFSTSNLNISSFM